MRQILLGLAAVWLLSACGGGPSLKAYRGPELGAAQLAFIDTAWSYTGCLSSVSNGGEVYYDIGRDGARGSVSLLPGTYDVAYSDRHYKTASVEHSDRLELKASHTYVIRSDVCYSFCFSMPPTRPSSGSKTPPVARL